MRAWLLADQVHLAHQLTYLEPPNLQAVLFHHQYDAPAARSASALRKADDMDEPGMRLHPLKGELAGFWSVSVSVIGG